MYNYVGKNLPRYFIASFNESTCSMVDRIRVVFSILLIMGVIIKMI